jgi:P4 family phage/plasmid primase-like protien
MEAVLAAATPASDFILSAVMQAGDGATPEGRSAIWKRLAGLAASIADEETRAQYRAAWRAAFDAAFPPLPPGLREEDMLPNGSVESLSTLPEVVRARLERVCAAWLARSIESTDKTAVAVGRWAWEAGRRVQAGLIVEEAARTALADMVAALVAQDATAKPEDIERAWDAGMKRGFDPGPLLLDMKCAGFQRTDLGNAERFHARFGRDYLYTTAKGWLGWDGRRYRVLNQEKDVTPAEVQAAVFETVRAIQRESWFMRDTGRPREDLDPEEMFADQDGLHGHPGAMDQLIVVGKKKELLSAKIASWGRASESSGRLGCIANLAKRWCTVEITDFDTNPMILNCGNGTLHFLRPDAEGNEGQAARVELRPHRREDMLTKLTPVDYDPEAQAAEFQKLVRWAQPKKERRRYLRQWAGYNLTGDMGEQIFHIWWGPTAANGKSTVGNVLREAIGDYGDITNVETFLDEGTKKRGDQATPDIVRLPGVRFLTSGEPPKGAKINEALINSVTGGDPMLARDNFRSFFRFTPSFKWTLWCNAKPDIPQGTEGIWRRVRVLLWESHLEPHERDRELPARLKMEHAGVLAWMVRGLIDWMDNGFVEPDDVKEQSAAYRDDSDPLASFLRMCTVEDPLARVQSSHLYDLFCAWCKAAGETEWKQKGFSRAMKDRGFSNKRTDGMYWLGLKMVKAVHDFVDHEGKVRSGIGDASSGDGDAASATGPPASFEAYDEGDIVPGF